MSLKGKSFVRYNYLGRPLGTIMGALLESVGTILVGVIPRMIEVLSRSIRIGNKQRTHEQLTIRSRSKSKPQDNALHEQGNGSVSDSLHRESMPPVLELN
jgi:hypothetical protein